MLLRFDTPALPAVLFLVTACLAAQNFEQQMEVEIEKLVAKHGTGTDEELKRRLNEMAKRDQAVRTRRYFPDKAGHLQESLIREQEKVDAQLTAELKDIVARKGWPTIRLVGVKASEHAALILIHSRDHEFQRAVMSRVAELADRGEILGMSIALIVDKILTSEGKPQRFGTQFKWTNGDAEMLSVEDPAQLDERRAKYLLPPMIEYKRILAEMNKVNVK